MECFISWIYYDIFIIIVLVIVFSERIPIQFKVATQNRGYIVRNEEYELYIIFPYLILKPNDQLTSVGECHLGGTQTCSEKFDPCLEDLKRITFSRHASWRRRSSKMPGPKRTKKRGGCRFRPEIQRAAVDGGRKATGFT